MRQRTESEARDRKNRMFTGSNCRANKTKKQSKAGEDKHTEQQQQPTTKPKQKATKNNATTSDAQKPPDGHETSDRERKKERGDENRNGPEPKQATQRSLMIPRGAQGQWAKLATTSGSAN